MSSRRIKGEILFLNEWPTSDLCHSCQFWVECVSLKPQGLLVRGVLCPWLKHILSFPGTLFDPNHVVPKRVFAFPGEAAIIKMQKHTFPRWGRAVFGYS